MNGKTKLNKIIITQIAYGKWLKHINTQFNSLLSILTIHIIHIHNKVGKIGKKEHIRGQIYRIFMWIQKNKQVILK